MRRLLRHLFTLGAALSLLVFAATYLLRLNTHIVINGHTEVEVFGRPVHEAIQWFVMDHLSPLPFTPVELVLYVSMVLPAWWVVSLILSRGLAEVRIRGGLCPSCGYDLRESPERCPECGTFVAPPSEC